MTAALSLPPLPDDSGAAATALEKARQVAAFVQANTPASASAAMSEADHIRDLLKQAETERDTIAKPLRAIVNAHAKKWKPSIDLLEQCRRLRVKQAQDMQAAERAEQAKALQAATSPAEVEQAVAVLAPKVAGLVEVSHWSAEIVDETKIPREYWLIDTQRLNREARERKEAFSVPGVRAVCEKRAQQR